MVLACIATFNIQGFDRCLGWKTLCGTHQSTLACGHRLVLHDVLLGRPWAHRVLVLGEVLFRRHRGLYRV